MPIPSLALNETTIALALLAALVIGLGVWVMRLDWRLRKLCRGKRAESLEHVIRALATHAQECESYQANARHALAKLEKNNKSTISGCGTVRFDAFAGSGLAGKQSFATALVNHHGDGVVFSSMHSRGNTRVFAKPLTQFASEYELTEEEREAVERARTHTHRTNAQ